MKVLTFDIGIRNLAWCLLEKGEGSWTVHGWENYDLIAGSGTQDAKTLGKKLCTTCSKKATHCLDDSSPVCARCCPVSKPALRDVSGGIIKVLPTLPGLKLLTTGLTTKKSKADLVAALQGKYTLPLVVPKVTKALSESLTTIHDSIRTFVQKNLTVFKEATHILLENQPAFKNPTMKSVQILLFATLRDFLCPTEATFGFVHASKKVQGKEVGDKGYASRKKGSEDRVKEFFAAETIREKDRWTAMLVANQKKSDLCDAFCMCVDRLEV